MNRATIELTAPAIFSAECQANIEGEVAGESAIEQVTGDAETRRIRIACDQEQTSPAHLQDKLNAIGYPAAP